MATYTALMNIQVDATQASNGLNRLDTNLGSIRRSSTSTSRTLKRLETQFQSVESVLNKTEKGISRISRTSTTTLNTLKRMEKQLSSLEAAVLDTNKALSTINTSIQNLNTTTRRAPDSIDKTNRSFGNLAKTVQKNQYIFALAVSTLYGFFSARLIAGIVQLTDEFVLMENKIRLAIPSTTKLADAMDNVYQIAQETRQPLTIIANLYSRIGRNSKQLRGDLVGLGDVVSTVSKAFQLGGATAEESRNALVQLSQALASGRLQGDELRSILELAPVLAQKISDSIGITVGSLRQFASEGLITTEVLINALLEASRSIREEFLKINPTIQQSLDVLRNSFERLIGTNKNFREANERVALGIRDLSRSFEQQGGVADQVGRVYLTLADNLDILAAAIVGVGTAIAGLALAGIVSLFFINPVVGITAAIAGLAAALTAYVTSSNAAEKATEEFYSSTEKLLSLTKDELKEYSPEELQKVQTDVFSRQRFITDEILKAQNELDDIENETVEDMKNFVNRRMSVFRQLQSVNETEMTEAEAKAQLEQEYLEKHKDFKSEEKAQLDERIKTLQDFLKRLQDFYNKLIGVTEGKAKEIFNAQIRANAEIQRLLINQTNYDFNNYVNGITTGQDRLESEAQKVGNAAGKAIRESFASEFAKTFSGKTPAQLPTTKELLGGTFAPREGTGIPMAKRGFDALSGELKDFIIKPLDLQEQASILDIISENETKWLSFVENVRTTLIREDQKISQFFANRKAESYTMAQELVSSLESEDTSTQYAQDRLALIKQGVSEQELANKAIENEISLRKIDLHSRVDALALSEEYKKATKKRIDELLTGIENYKKSLAGINFEETEERRRDSIRAQNAELAKSASVQDQINTLRKAGFSDLDINLQLLTNEEAANRRILQQKNQSGEISWETLKTELNLNTERYESLRALERSKDEARQIAEYQAYSLEVARERNLEEARGYAKTTLGITVPQTDVEISNTTLLQLEQDRNRVLGERAKIENQITAKAKEYNSFTQETTKEQRDAVKTELEILETKLKSLGVLEDSLEKTIGLKKAEEDRVQALRDSIKEYTLVGKLAAGMLAGFGEGLSNAIEFIFTAYKDDWIELFNIIKDSTSEFTSNIFTAIGSGIENISDYLSNISLSKFLDDTKSLFKDISSGISSLFSGEGGALSMVSSIAKFGGASGQRASNIIDVGLKTGDPLAALGAAILSNEKVQEALSKLFDAVFKFIDPFIDLLGPVIDIFTAFITNSPLMLAVNALKPLLKNLGDALGALSKAIGALDLGKQGGTLGYIFGGGLARSVENFFTGGGKREGYAADQLANMMLKIVQTGLDDVRYDITRDGGSAHLQYSRDLAKINADYLDEFTSNVEDIGFGKAMDGIEKDFKDMIKSIQDDANIADPETKAGMIRLAEEQRDFVIDLLRTAYFEDIAQGLLDPITTDIQSILDESLTPIQQVQKKHQETMKAYQDELQKLVDTGASTEDIQEFFEQTSTVLSTSFQRLQMELEKLRIASRDLADEMELDYNTRAKDYTDEQKLVMDYAKERISVLGNEVLLEEEKKRVIDSLNEALERELALLERQKQLETIDSLLAGLSQIQSDLEAALESISDLIRSLFDQVQELLFSEFNLDPYMEKYEQASVTYQKLLEQAFSPDATEQDIQDLQGFVNTYLTSARDVFKSSSKFQEIFEGVLQDLTKLGIGAGVTLTVNAVEEAKEAIAELGQELGVSTSDLIYALDQATIAFVNQRVELINNLPVVDLSTIELDYSNITNIDVAQLLIDTNITGAVEAFATTITGVFASTSAALEQLRAAIESGSSTTPVVNVPAPTTPTTTTPTTGTTGTTTTTPTVPGRETIPNVDIPVISGETGQPTGDTVTVGGYVDPYKTFDLSSFGGPSEISKFYKYPFTSTTMFGVTEPNASKYTLAQLAGMSVAKSEGLNYMNQYLDGWGPSLITGSDFVSLQRTDSAAMSAPILGWLARAQMDFGSANKETDSTKYPKYFVFGKEHGNKVASITGYTSLSKAQALVKNYQENPYLSTNFAYQQYGFQRGGLVPGPMDTIPAMLAPGEFIMSEGAVNRMGVGTLRSLNSGFSASGLGSSDPDIKRLLTAILSTLRDSSDAPEVHVYTDMKGEAKAAVNEFRSELRERSKRQNEKYVNVRYV